MLEYNRQQLDEIMARYNQDMEGIKAQKNSELVSQNEFAKKFEQIKKNVIWPAFVDVGNQLNNYGHDYHVSEEDEYVDATAHYTPSNITLNIFPSFLGHTSHHLDSSPYISFVSNKYAKKVVIMVSTMMPGAGGVIGTNGEHDISDITTDFVEQRIIDVLQKTLIFHR